MTCMGDWEICSVSGKVQKNSGELYLDGIMHKNDESKSSADFGTKKKIIKIYNMESCCHHRAVGKSFDHESYFESP